MDNMGDLISKAYIDIFSYGDVLDSNALKIKKLSPKLFISKLKELVDYLNNESLKSNYGSSGSINETRLISGFKTYYDRYPQLKQLIHINSNKLVVDWELVQNNIEAVFVVFYMIENGGSCIHPVEYSLGVLNILYP